MGEVRAGATKPSAPAVLVAGAGPVGLVAAHELARRGVPVRVVDRAAGPATTSRALAVHARTMEILEQMGVLRDLMPLGRKVEHFSLHMRGRTLIRFDTNYSALPTRFPFSLMVDQVVTERVLRERLARLGVEVEWGVGLEEFTPHEDRVDVRLSGPGGSTELLSVPWLVGTDGAHSTVRKSLGLQLLGDATETWLNADVVVADLGLPPDSNHLLHTGKGTLLMVPFPQDGKWRVIDTQDIGDADRPEVVRTRLESKISAAVGHRVTVGEPTWISVFTVQQRMITSMRVGRCFVAGDAAHVHSPASGQGMNAGIQDAYNLSWKLADVVRGFAEYRLLDSYSAERVPIGERLLGSTRLATALVSLRNVLGPILLPVGMGVMRLVGPLKRKLERKMIRGFCGLNVEYPTSPINPPPPAAGTGQVRGPLPGQRVGCTEQAHRDHAGWRALCEELADPRWTLLLPADAARVAGELPERLDRTYGALSVRALCDLDFGQTGPRPLLDAGGTVRADLGLAPGDYALIRPDGYLAAKGPLRRSEELIRLLGRIGLAAAGNRPAEIPGAH
ncbi:NADPH-dependent dioxygenase [Actinacidiphila yanglinensis]|uniref:NADPH-dependent dioxygenase n=1 Tax=Actinacidiphila yanglinensis TaxID=310779 RepID=A0A1H6E9P8_9ACTN|nr:FAD-dependent oxidoreductase [Actinacidiphila yanglinensis]SEG93555.1 NADPH-dependent dioxygenase [Actinacidiphila yanglinensis]